MKPRGAYNALLQCDLSGFMIADGKLLLDLGGPCDMDGAIAFADTVARLMDQPVVHVVTAVDGAPDTEYLYDRVSDTWSARRCAPQRMAAVDRAYEFALGTAALEDWLSRPGHFEKFSAIILHNAAKMT